MKVAVLGASADPTRYAFKAVQALLGHGHEPMGVSPKLPAIGVPVVARLEELPEGIDTLAVYVGPERSRYLREAILAYPFRRVILNPGAENPELAGELRARGVEVVEACTLVMLATGHF